MDIRKFVNDAFGDLDVFVDSDGNLWFPGNEIARALGYDNSNLTNVVRRFVEKNDLKTLKYKASLKTNEAILWNRPNDYSDKLIISEYGMYSLVMRSKVEKAREFQHWVTHEVLPSIRKNGGYISGQEELKENNPAEYEKILSLVKVLSEKVKNQNEKMAFLQKRRHELIAAGKKNQAAIKKLKAEEKELNYLADMYERQIASLQKDLDKYYPRRTSGYKPAATETTVVGPDGFVVSRKIS